MGSFLRTTFRDDPLLIQSFEACTSSDVFSHVSSFCPVRGNAPSRPVKDQRPCNLLADGRGRRVLVLGLYIDIKMQLQRPVHQLLVQTLHTTCDTEMMFEQIVLPPTPPPPLLSALVLSLSFSLIV
ncbi:hypothetical protein INR49_006384 [Caranx melampygus]|nr:hypothetical protein INR49_006384 [Caranx melampygus]